MDEAFLEKRGPGRPPKQQENRVEEVKAQRRRREDLGDNTNAQLFIPETAKDPNFEYRWINDTTEGRLFQKTKFDDWDVVSTSELKGYVSSDKDNGEGSQVRRIVGRNGDKPLYAYLCRKPKEYHKADKAKEQAAIAEQEAQMKRGPLPSNSGLRPAESYVPGGANTITHGS